MKTLTLQERAAQWFDNNFDCYADVENRDNVMALTRDKFLEFLTEAATLFSEQDKWVSVETKPDPSKPLLVVSEGVVMRAKYIPKHHMDCDDCEFHGNTDYNEEQDRFYWPEGWYEWNETEEMHWLIRNVTGWQPLPAAPKV